MGVAQELPSGEELEVLVEGSLSSFWEVQDFRVIANASVGDPINPRALVRFEADVSPVKDLFAPMGETVGPFKIIVPTMMDQDIRTLFGTFDLAYRSGKWNGTPNIENPLTRELGWPRDMFSAPTIVMGSEEQSDLLETMRSNEIAMARARLARELADVQAEYDAKIAAAERTLQKTLDGLRTQLEDAERKQQTELATLRAQHEPEIAAEKERLAAALEELRTKHAERVGALKAAQAEEIARLQNKFAVRQASLEKQLAEARQVIAAQEELQAILQTLAENDDRIAKAQAPRVENMRAFLESFGKQIPISIGCIQTGGKRREAINGIFKVEVTKSTGLFGFFQAGREKFATSLILANGADRENMKFDLSVDFSRFIGDYNLTLKPDGSLTGASTGMMKVDYNNDLTTCQALVAIR